MSMVLNNILYCISSLLVSLLSPAAMTVKLQLIVWQTRYIVFHQVLHTSCAVLFAMSLLCLGGLD